MDYKRILWTSLLILAAGILLLCYKQPSLDFCVMCLGGLLVASSVLNIAMQFAYSRQSKEDNSRHSLASIGGTMTAIASGALGLWMLFAPVGFTTAMVYVFGALMIFGGLYLVCLMLFVYRPVKFPAGFYILPSLVAVCGIVMCVLPPATTKDIIIKITSIVMIVFAVGAIIVVSGLSSYQRSLKKAAKAEAEAAAAPQEPEVTEIPESSVTEVKPETAENSEKTE